MPLIKITTLPSGSLLGLWRISETIEQILLSIPSLSDLYSSIKHLGSKNRILEKLCVQALLIEMTGKHDIRISHNADGCPFLDGWHVSISHTKGFAAVILSRNKGVAVDIEFVSSRVSKVASKFIREDEHCVNLIQQLITWCAKETVYKYYSAQHLDFFDIRLHTFMPSSSGIVLVDNIKSDNLISVNFVVTPEYVLTYIE